MEQRLRRIQIKRNVDSSKRTQTRENTKEKRCSTGPPVKYQQRETWIFDEHINQTP